MIKIREIGVIRELGIVISIWPAGTVASPTDSAPNARLSAAKTPFLSNVTLPLKKSTAWASGLFCKYRVGKALMELPLVNDNVPSTERSPAIVVCPRNVSPKDLKVAETVASIALRFKVDVLSVMLMLAKVAEPVARRRSGGVKLGGEGLGEAEGVEGLESPEIDFRRSLILSERELKLAEVEATF